jgi:hypothetical protein
LKNGWADAGTTGGVAHDFEVGGGGEKGSWDAELLADLAQWSEYGTGGDDEWERAIDVDLPGKGSEW